MQTGDTFMSGDGEACNKPRAQVAPSGWVDDGAVATTTLSWSLWVLTRPA